MLQELSRQHQAHKERRARMMPKVIPIQHEKPREVPVIVQPEIKPNYNVTYFMPPIVRPEVVYAAAVPKCRDIQSIVANFYNVSMLDLLSVRRTPTLVHPRHIAMYLCKKLTGVSLPQIGKKFAGRDHTTILHAVRKIEGLLLWDERLADEVYILRIKISEHMMGAA